jgi:hypothetical protein
MPKYLYCFGSETPGQARRNRSFSVDDEDSEAVYIEAADPEQALAWGEEVSERFIRLLFRDPQVSWREMDFARWIAHDAEPDGVPTVRVGEDPDYDRWLARYSAEWPAPEPTAPEATGFRRFLRFLGGWGR